MTHRQLNDMLKVMLVCGAGVKPQELQRYSVHSFRATLCSLLFKLKCPVDRIKRILRWRSDDSVLLYGRIDDDEWTDWLERSRDTEMSSEIASRLHTETMDLNMSDEALTELNITDLDDTSVNDTSTRAPTNTADSHSLQCSTHADANTLSSQPDLEEPDCSSTDIAAVSVSDGQASAQTLTCSSAMSGSEVIVNSLLTYNHSSADFTSTQTSGSSKQTHANDHSKHANVRPSRKNMMQNTQHKIAKPISKKPKKKGGKIIHTAPGYVCFSKGAFVYLANKGGHEGELHMVWRNFDAKDARTTHMPGGEPAVLTVQLLTTTNSPAEPVTQHQIDNRGPPHGSFAMSRATPWALPASKVWLVTPHVDVSHPRILKRWIEAAPSEKYYGRTRPLEKLRFSFKNKIARAWIAEHTTR